jgi:hypothetical protein
VKVRHPEVTHVVRMQDFENWLSRGCKSPADTVLKTRLHQMLSMSKQEFKEDRMRWATDLRRELSVRGQQIAVINGSVHELTTGEMPSVIFGRNESRQHGNFYPASWRNICANPEWARRLVKVHSGSRRALPRAGWRWRELDCANSSDALLMNIFCCRRTLRNPALSSMLGVPSGLVPHFGFRPEIPLRSGRRTAPRST